MKWLFGLCALALSVVLALPEAEARRFGGGRSIGIQRNVQKAPPAATPAKPAQQQNAPAAASSKWGPILGGLALGGILAYLFSGQGLAALLLVALLAFAAVMAFRVLAQRRAPAPQRMQYAGFGNETVAAPPPPSGSAGVQAPAGFDAQAFLRGAKTNFIKLQLANDAGAMEEIREFTTDEMFSELSRERARAGQQTDVVALDAQLLEVATEGDRHWASVRFSGQVRETPGGEAAAFSEVWHLAKPVDGSSGWLLAGIQQMH
ncbi:MAG TPA: Tim44-like domain-containing protein [Burkholderiales bacterium]